MLPYILSIEQIDSHKNVSSDYLNAIEHDPLLGKSDNMDMINVGYLLMIH